MLLGDVRSGHAPVRLRRRADPLPRPLRPPCVALDQCHVAGVCDFGTGRCTDPPAADGATCTGKNACYQTSTCQEGVCTASDPVVCTALDAYHLAGT